MANTIWSSEQKATLRRAWTAGERDDAVLAAKLGRSVRAVQIMRSELGLVKRRCHRARAASEIATAELIDELRDRGYSVIYDPRVLLPALSGVMHL